MNLGLSAEERELVAAVQAFLSDWRPVPGNSSSRAAYFRALCGRGWSVPLWPERWGGGDLTAEETYLVDRTLILAGAPVLSPLTVATIGPLLMSVTTEASCQRWLPGMARGELKWCAHGSLLGGRPVEGRLQADEFVSAAGALQVMGAGGADLLMGVAVDGEKADLVVAELVPESVLPGGPLDPDTVFAGSLSFERLGSAQPETELRRLIEVLSSSDLARSYSRTARLRYRFAEIDRVYQDQDQDSLGVSEMVELDVVLRGLEVLERRALHADTTQLREVLAVKVAEVGEWLSRLAVQALGYYALPAPDPARQHNELPVAALTGQDAIGELIRYVGGLEAVTARDRIAALELGSFGSMHQQGE